MRWWFKEIGDQFLTVIGFGVVLTPVVFAALIIPSKFLGLRPYEVLLSLDLTSAMFFLLWGATCIGVIIPLLEAFDMWMLKHRRKETWDEFTEAVRAGKVVLPFWSKTPQVVEKYKKIWRVVGGVNLVATAIFFLIVDWSQALS